MSAAALDAAALALAARRKAEEGARVQQAFFADAAEDLARCAAALAVRFADGARLFAMGNGGSACDAEHAVVEFMHPVVTKRRTIAAQAIGRSPALLSAIGNDQDFSMAFADELRLLGRPGDVVLALSTRGDSANVGRALAVAREMGLVAVGLSGRDGGRMSSLCDHLFVVPSYSIHRIQEVHVAILHVLWDLVHLASGEEDVL